MSVERTSSRTTLRPRHSIRENAYATGTDDSTTPTVESPAYTNEFHV